MMQADWLSEFIEFQGRTRLDGKGLESHVSAYGT
jgi:hypothetical protein